MSGTSVSLTRIVSAGLLVVLIAVTLVCLAAWTVPLEVAQGWAVARAGSNEFARREAFDASAVALVFVRWASTISLIPVIVVWAYRRRFVPSLTVTLQEFWQATRPDFGGRAGASAWNTFRKIVVRTVIVAWLILSLYHFGCSVQRRLWDWPVYRLVAGQTILPNISESNREVIRYLAATTPDNARILIVSDQKLYFLSYYLLPRRLYHPTHPDSEFVIAQAYNQRQMAAYRLQDVDPALIDRLKPDYILEYFEGVPFIEGQDLYRDGRWIDYEQRRHGAKWRPQYLVSLRSTSLDSSSPGGVSSGGRP